MIEICMKSAQAKRFIIIKLNEQRFTSTNKIYAEQQQKMREKKTKTNDSERERAKEDNHIPLTLSTVRNVFRFFSVRCLHLPPSPPLA